MPRWARYTTYAVVLFVSLGVAISLLTDDDPPWPNWVLALVLPLIVVGLALESIQRRRYGEPSPRT